MVFQHNRFAIQPADFEKRYIRGRRSGFGNSGSTSRGYFILGRIKDTISEFKLTETYPAFS